MKDAQFLSFTLVLLGFGILSLVYHGVQEWFASRNTVERCGGPYPVDNGPPVVGIVATGMAVSFLAMYGVHHVLVNNPICSW